MPPDPSPSSLSDAPGALVHGLLVVHANRFEDAVDLALEALRRNPPPPLQALWVLTPGSGMRGWLEQRIAQVLGVCAGVRFDWPGAFLWRLARDVLGEAAVPTRFALDKPTLVWRLMHVLSALAPPPDAQGTQAAPDAPVAAGAEADADAAGLPSDWAQDARWQPLRRHLQGDARAQRRYALALELADVFDGYQTYRPDWLDDWAAGRDRWDSGPGGDAALPAEQSWQALLWRCVLAQGGLGAADARAGVLAQWVARLQDAASDQVALRALLPAQVLVVGFASLPPQTLQALAALARHRPVWVTLHNPSPYFWGDDPDLSAQARRHWRSRHVALAPAAGAGHPLLSAWGQVGRDGLAAWDALDAQQAARAQLGGLRLDCFVDPLAACAGSPTRLAHWQSDVFHLRPAPAQPEALADDDSITLVGCSSALREIEVLHDHLLAWFEADPSLQPQHVIVMAPDLGAIAPLIDAVFGRHRPGAPGYLPYTLADAAAQPAPLVRALGLLLQGAQAHWTLAQTLELLDVPGVRAHFGLSEADAARALAWLQQADLRWGLDGAQRQALGLALPAAQLEPGTWAQVLRRLLLGYALGRDGLWAGLNAQPGWAGLDADLAGALLALFDALVWAQNALRGTHPPAVWGQTLGELMRRFITAQADEQADWLAAQRALQDWCSACADAGFARALPLEVVRTHWLNALSAAPASPRWLSGGVQFATLMPMRAVPFRAVALIGLNDGDYPRSPVPRAFDLLGQAVPRPGDRSRRDDDRYLLLQALLAARERLYLSWCSRSARDGSAREPSVLVAQLRQDWAQRWQNPPPLRHQPVQPFSRAYAQPDSSCFTYAAQWQPFWATSPVRRAQNATETIANRVAVQPADQVSAQPVASAGPSAHTAQARAPDLADLLALLRQPSAVYTRQRLRLPPPQDLQAWPEAEVFALDALADWQLRQDLLRSPSPSEVGARWRDALPLGARAEYEQELALQRMSSVRKQLQKLQQSWRPQAAVHDLVLPLAQAAGGVLRQRLATQWRTPQGQAVQFEVRAGRLWADVKPSVPAPRVRVGAQPWLTHLMANAAGCPLQTHVLAEDGHWTLSACPQDVARAALARLVAVWVDAWATLAPLPAESAWAAWLAHAQAVRAGQAAQQAQQAAAQALAALWCDRYRRGKDPLPGEKRQLPLLERAHPQAADLLAAGLLDWAERVYGDWGRACLIDPNEEAA